MIKQLFIASILYLALCAAPASAFHWTMTDPATGQSMTYELPESTSPLQFNPAHPSGWAIFMNPGTHAAFMNPATYGQFMSPQFYMQFMDPNNWMAWMNPAAYGPWMNPSTYMQWMNPAAYAPYMNPMTYMQWMNPGNYMAFMNPATYMQWMNPAAYAIPGAQSYGNTAAGFNWFDPNTWVGLGQTPQDESHADIEGDSEGAATPENGSADDAAQSEESADAAQ